MLLGYARVSKGEDQDTRMQETAWCTCALDSVVGSLNSRPRQEAGIALTGTPLTWGPLPPEKTCPYLSTTPVESTQAPPGGE